MLEDYKKRVDLSVEELSLELKQKYADRSPAVQASVGAYIDLLSRGGRRMRGVLLLLSHDMFDGSRNAQAGRLAAIIEMIQAYLLLFDDIADQSDIRRGRPSVHRLLEAYLGEQQPGADEARRASNLSQMAGLLSVHEIILKTLELELPQEMSNQVLAIMQRHLIETTIGQIDDIYAEFDTLPTVEKVTAILSHKTPFYSVVSPLQIGAVLAGKVDQLADIECFGHATGLGFQILNDILGTFDETYEVGKSNLDDIRGGKKTLQVVYALEHASPDERLFLTTQLGNSKLKVNNFNKCKDIIISSGGLQYALDEMWRQFELANSVLASKTGTWQEEYRVELLHLLEKFQAHLPLSLKTLAYNR